MNNPFFETGHIYHIVNRGVDKRRIFMDTDDFERGIQCLYEYNDNQPTFNFRRHRSGSKEKQENILHKERAPVVDVLAFSLMKNHIHLLLKQLIDGGISKFMHKFGTGYTNYFNLKYERSGSLFQGRFKGIQINREAHFLYLPYYIHANSLDYFDPGWRRRKIQNPTAAMQFLENYKWSSLPDYLGKINFPYVSNREFLLSLHGGNAEYKNDFTSWIKDIAFDTISPVALESITVRS